MTTEQDHLDSFGIAVVSARNNARKVNSNMIVGDMNTVFIADCLADLCDAVYHLAYAAHERMTAIETKVGKINAS